MGLVVNYYLNRQVAKIAKNITNYELRVKNWNRKWTPIDEYNG
jgi:hypothetical protein